MELHSVNSVEEEHLNTVVMGGIDPVKLEVTMDEDLSLASYKQINKQKHMDEYQINNPWAVGDASAFLKYCCPECDYQILNLQMFSDHALENHTKAIALFGPITKTEEGEDLELKRETLDHENDGLEEDMINDDQIDDTFEDPDFEPGETTLPLPDLTKVEAMEPLDFPNSCSFCEFSSTSVIDIIQHHSEFHEDETPPYFKCNHCEFFAKKKRAVQEHSRKIHGKHFIPYKCRTCGKKIGKIQTFRDHIKARVCKKPRKGISKFHPSTMPVTCKICGKQLSNQSVLRKHTLSMHKEAKEKAACELCHQECSTLDLLKEHRMEKHQSGKFKLCLYCDYKSEGWVQLKCHIDATHSEHGGKTHLCDLCGKGFIFEASCRIHKRDRHQKNVCHICGNEYLCKNSLKEHLIFVHKDKEQSSDFFCEICGFSTPSKIQLNKHIRVKHAVEKHKKCPHCDYHTPSIQRIHVHIDGKHPEHGKKQFFCDHCPRGYIFEHSLKKHLENLRTMALNRAKKEKKHLTEKF